MAFELVCTACGARYDNSRYRVSCETCEGLLDVEYDAPAGEGAWGAPGATGLARYARMLPITSVSDLVTLGEGDTPLLRLERLGSTLGVDLYVKLEYLNPTGSFKDRGNAVQVTVLRETGVDTVVDSTTGNAGHSTAAYCARAGIRYIGFSEKGARDFKLQAAAYHGTELHPVGGSKDGRREAALRYSQDTGVVFMDYGRNAYFIEGEKTLSYEIAEQMDPLPDHVVAASGNGSILLGMWRGFQDLRESGRVQRLPRFHAAQSEAFQPMVAAYHGRDWAPQPGATSVAIGVTIAAPAAPGHGGPHLQGVGRSGRRRARRGDPGVAGAPGQPGGNPGGGHFRPWPRGGEDLGLAGRHRRGRASAGAAHRFRHEGAAPGEPGRLRSAMPTFPHRFLEGLASQVLRAAGASEEEAQLVAERCVRANLVGHDSHGVIQIPTYVERIGLGHIVPGAPMEVLDETPTTARVDGHWGFGFVVSTRAMEMAIRKAK